MYNYSAYNLEGSNLEHRIFDIIFLARGLTPSADSFAESLTAFCIFLILDFPGTYGSIIIFLNLNTTLYYSFDDHLNKLYIFP